ncbi:MAG: valine--tRNA ligase [Acidimicrobiia bacterium]
MSETAASSSIPEKPSIDGLEDKWSQVWERDGTFRFDRARVRDQVYSIDTPPPTVSGSLHVGHVFSYTHTDALARFHRMRGREVFYPMGWDDNGLPTERRVQNVYGVRCEPHLPYDPNFEAPTEPADPPISISRRNFVELCDTLVVQDEEKFEELWRHLGLSVDWSMTYTTVGKSAQRISQRAFILNYERGEAYNAEAPSLWDVDFKTAVAQAELEDREKPGAYHRVRFHGTGDTPDIWIETTRPELVPACVALVAHPDDERYQPYFGGVVKSPLFGVEVPVHAHPLADPEKGSGIAMICTFGDTTDVVWWRELNLPTRSVMGADGRLVATPPEVITGDAAAQYAELAGKTANQARKRIAELLAEAGDMEGEPRPITHPVKFFEKGDRPLEIITTRQWYIRNGGRDAELRKAFIERGAQLQWHPPYMQARYTSWVEGLNGDWLISRQRYFGVPVPVWYPIDANGTANYDAPLMPTEEMLPVDPGADVPPGYAEDQRDQPNGFAADLDIFDTWATSSLTPQIAGKWLEDDDLFERVYPMDLRPQAHEIIRTWLFSTVVRAHYEFDALPWSNVGISGWVLDPDRKKMSKSKGNVVLPTDLLDKHGADAVRYWAISGRPGTDTAVDEGQMKIGRRLAIKLLNASKFVLGIRDQSGFHHGTVTNPVDRAMLAALANVVDEATVAFEGYDWARALDLTERFFWTFCDDYVELVKARAYGSQGAEGAESAATALGTALSVLQRLFAPHIPFVTEEVWGWWQAGSVHRAAWPNATELHDAAADGNPAVFENAAQLLSAIRKAKSAAQVSLKTQVTRASVVAPAPAAFTDAVVADVKEAGNALEIVISAGDEFAAEVELAPAE